MEKANRERTRFDQSVRPIVPMPPTAEWFNMIFIIQA